MKHVFLDSNIFIRFLAGDHRRMSRDCRRLFVRIEQGALRAETNFMVIAEIIWVLQSFYKVKKEKIVEYIILLLRMKNLVVRDEYVINKALDIFNKNNVDFIDAFCLSWVGKRKIKYICSYDRDYDKIAGEIEGVKRIEPK